MMIDVEIPNIQTPLIQSESLSSLQRYNQMTTRMIYEIFRGIYRLKTAHFSSINSTPPVRSIPPPPPLAPKRSTSGEIPPGKRIYRETPAIPPVSPMLPPPPSTELPPIQNPEPNIQGLITLHNTIRHLEISNRLLDVFHQSRVNILVPSELGTYPLVTPETYPLAVNTLISMLATNAQEALTESNQQVYTYLSSLQS